MTEKALQAAFVAAVKSSPGAMCYHTYDSRRSEEGFPDLLVLMLRPPGVWFLELKTEAGQLSGPQKAWARTIAAVGGNWREVRPSNAAAVAAEMGLTLTMPELAATGRKEGRASSDGTDGPYPRSGDGTGARSAEEVRAAIDAKADQLQRELGIGEHAAILTAGRLVREEMAGERAGGR